TWRLVGVADLGIAPADQHTLTSAPMGGGTAIDETCQSSGTINEGITIEWRSSAYRVIEGKLSNVNAGCNGKAYQLQMLQGAAPSQVALGANLTGTLAVTGGNATITVTGTQPLAADVTGVALVIQG